jgi:hypothetical protein
MTAIAAHPDFQIASGLFQGGDVVIVGLAAVHRFHFQAGIVRLQGVGQRLGGVRVRISPIVKGEEALLDP